MKRRDDIMAQVDGIIKKEDESNYLKMILHTTQRRLMINARERNMLYNGGDNKHRGGGYYGHGVPPHVEGASGAHDHGPGGEGVEEEKKDRYQRLAQKFKDRVQGKRLCPEAREVFDEGIEKLLGAKNKESLDVETTKQYLDWISSLPWNHYSVDNADIESARRVLDLIHGCPTWDPTGTPMCVCCRRTQRRARRRCGGHTRNFRR